MSSRRAQPRAGGTRGSRARTPALLLALAAAATVAVPAQGLDTGSEPIPAGQAAEVTVSLAHGHPGRPVPREFLGLSFELSSAAQIARYARAGNFTHMLRSLGPGILRFGGVSADTRVAWSDAHTPPAPWAGAVIEAADLRRLRALAAASGWRVLLTLGLAHFDAQAAARETLAAHRILGPWLAGIEVGNEPDAYGHHALRALPWTATTYEGEVSAYRKAIGRRVRGIPLAGPGVSGSRAFAHWGAAEARRQHPALLTGHHYPLRCDRQPSIEALLSEDIRAKEALSLKRYLSVARRFQTPFRMDEANTVSCGGRPGISDTFASALWATGYITQAMAAGASGINLQGNPGNCTGYSPVCASSPARLAAGTLQAQPEWYGLLLTHSLVGYRPLPIRILAPGRPDLALAVFGGHRGALKVVIVEDDPPGTPGAAIKMHLRAGSRTASVTTLQAPAQAARTGVRLGGRAVAADGSWHAASTATIQGRAGTLSLHVPASSAALITLSPR
jgi:hypothetical protein